MPPTPPVLRALRLLALTAITKGASLDATAPSEAGRPLVRTFTRQEHKAHAQFHAPFQSPEGLMYFGNQLAVMEYAGRSWRVLKIPLPFTRALAPGPTGDIYVGDDDQIGVLARPDSGAPRFRSLLRSRAGRRQALRRRARCARVARRYFFRDRQEPAPLPRAQRDV